MCIHLISFFFIIVAIILFLEYDAENLISLMIILIDQSDNQKIGRLSK